MRTAFHFRRSSEQADSRGQKEEAPYNLIWMKYLLNS